MSWGRSAPRTTGLSRADTPGSITAYALAIALALFSSTATFAQDPPTDSETRSSFTESGAAESNAAETAEPAPPPPVDTTERTGDDTTPSPLATGSVAAGPRVEATDASETQAPTNVVAEALSYWRLGDPEQALTLLAMAEQSARATCQQDGRAGVDGPGTRLSVDDAITLWLLRAHIFSDLEREQGASREQVRRELARILSVRPTFSPDDARRHLGTNPDHPSLADQLRALRGQAPLLLLSVEVFRDDARVALEATTQDQAGAGLCTRIRARSWEGSLEAPWHQGGDRLVLPSGGMIQYEAEVLGPGRAVLATESATVPGRPAAPPMETSLAPPPPPRRALAIAVSIATLSAVVAVVVVALAVDRENQTSGRFSAPRLE